MKPIGKKTIFLFVIFLMLFVPALLQSEEPKAGTELHDHDLNILYKEYNPIDHKKPVRQYYPDDVEKRVDDFLIDSYLGNTDRLQSYYDYFQKKDRELKRQNKPLTGLSDNVLLIINSHVKDRDEYIKVQKEALKRLNDKDLKTLVKMKLEEENLTKAEKLLRDEKKNKVGRVFNSLLSSVDIISLSVGSILGTTIDTAVQTIMNIKDINKISAKEKRAIVQFEEHLKKDPDSPYADEVLEKLERLKEKKKRAAYRKEIEKAELFLKEERFEDADRSYQKALGYYPESKKAKEGLKETRFLMEQREKSIRTGLDVSKKPPHFSSPEEKRDYQELLYVVVRGDPEEIIQKSQAFIKNHKRSSLKDEAYYNLSVAYDMQGKHEKAKEAMEELSRKRPGSNMGYHAKLLLNDENYNKYKNFQEARKEHTRDTIKYALGGKELAKNNIGFGTSRIILEGVKSVETLGMANLLSGFLRATSLVGNDPISNNKIIDMGEQYLALYPESEKSDEVRYELAKAYEREKDYGSALKYYQLSGKASQKKIDSIHKKIVKVLMQKADLTSSWEAKTYYYKTVLASYPDTKEAKKAEVKLAELLRIEDQRYRLSKEFILENRELFGPDSLNIKQELLDGDLKNKEIADKGLSFLRDDRIKIYYQTKEGIEEKTYQMNRNTIDNFEAKLREFNYKKAISRKGPEGIYTKEGSLDEALNNVYLSEDEKKKREKKIDFGADANISPSGDGFSSQGVMKFRQSGAGLAFGIDQRSPNVGFKVPVPKSPVEIESRIGEGRFSLYPKIRLNSDEGNDYYLYQE